MNQARVRTKICGITRVEDARAAAIAGVDAIGLVFYANSPRHVSIQRAAEIVDSLPPLINVVGLFVNADVAAVKRVLDQVRLDLLQFHGDETPAYCQSFGMPYIKALRMRPGINLLECAVDFTSATMLLLDTYQENVAGGTGQTFEWNLIPPRLPKPIMLAGGLTPDNVGAAIRCVRPYAVDVSGGVEQKKGIKDAVKIAAFMRGVVDATL